MKKLLFIISVVMLLVTGCAPTSNEAFYWGDYSSTLYDLKKSPSDTTLSLHKAELLLIIEKSEKRKTQVPPGVFAEYGYILLKTGEENMGMEYLDKEALLYPESIVFITRLKNEYARREK
jgi:hypothetical protein